MIKTILALVAPSLVSQIVFGALVAALSGGLVWHLVAVNNAYENGATAARQKCSEDAARVKEKAETAYQLRARRLEAALTRAREDDQKTEDSEAVTTGLEGVLAKMKADPQCWSKETVREIQR